MLQRSRTLVRPLLAAAVSECLLASASADTIKLKSGASLSGKVL
jgi:hypothetical protein